jgi:predicted O-methyltransferase YrrM
VHLSRIAQNLRVAATTKRWESPVETLWTVSAGWAARHPWATVASLVGNKEALHRLTVVRTAKFLLGPHADMERWHEATREVAAGDFVPMRQDGAAGQPSGNALRLMLGKWLYCSIRALQPAIVVETGVASGASSWVILNALHRNGHGRLHSIDLPNSDPNRNYRIGAREPGWAVPDTLRDRWTLHIGSARELLPGLLESVGKVGVFFHDSDHSFEHMRFEFDTVLPYMLQGGLIISDDIQKNAAFEDFTKRARLRSAVFAKGGCLIVENAMAPAHHHTPAAT